MDRFLKTLSLAPRSIRHKLTVAFALMSLIPILVCGYFVAFYIFPMVETIWDIYLILIITLFLMLLGCFLARKMIYPLVEISAHVKLMAEGDRLDKVLEVEGEDEIGELSGSLNRLSTRLNENMSELRSYGKKIKQINMEINKKVFALSSLLQIGNLITMACNLDEVFGLIVEKLSQLESGGPAFLMLLDEASGQLRIRTQVNVDAKEIGKVNIGRGPLGDVFQSARNLVIDAQKRPKNIDQALLEALQAKNIAVVPVASSGKVIGILGVGNKTDNFLFLDDEVELIGVFAKQVSVALENDQLMRKTKELTVRDELTGLYNEGYIRSRLDEEIKRATSYQRPCSFVILEVDNFKRFRDLSGEIEAEQSLKKIAQTLKESTTDTDKVGRFSDHQFAMILPEKNKHQSFNLAENIRKEIERFGLKQKITSASVSPLTLSGGISATPIDGTSSVELVNKVLYDIEKAKGLGANKIVA